MCGTGARGREGRITGSRNLSLRCECFLLKQTYFYHGTFLSERSIRARVLPTPCHATRNLSFLRSHRHRHPVVSTFGFTGLVQVRVVGVKIPQD